MIFLGIILYGQLTIIPVKQVATAVVIKIRGHIFKIIVVLVRQKTILNQGRGRPLAHLVARWAAE